MTLEQALAIWLDQVWATKSNNTHKTCKQAASLLKKVLGGEMALDQFDADQYSVFLARLKEKDARTEKLYAGLIASFCAFLVDQDMSSINLAKVQYRQRHETRKVGHRERDMDKDLLGRFRQFVLQLEPFDLPMARAKAWITLMFESGLRVHEACGLRRSNMNFRKLRGNVIGKGDKEAPFFFSSKSVRAIQLYLVMRREKEPFRGKNIPISRVPLFVGHSNRNGERLSPIDTDTARLDLVRLARMFEVVDLPNRKPEEDTQTITSHLLRHFFVDLIWTTTKDPVVTRLSARHVSGSTTEGYIHTDDEAVEKAVRRAHEIEP